MQTGISTTRRRWLGGLVALALAAGVAPSLAAQGPGRGWGRGPGGLGGPGGAFGPGLPLRQLELTDAQRDQVRSIMQGHQEEFRALGDRMRTARKAQHEAVTAESFNEAAVRSASATVAEVEADAAVLRARVHQEVWAVLTPEQKEKAKAFQAQREERMEQRRERREDRIRQRRGNPAL
jgi:protein CpxP